MSIVMNGTTIPTKKGNIKFNGTEITEVICNGTSVWKVVTDPIYIIKAGEVQTGYANPSIAYYGHTARSGYVVLGSGVYVYGVYAHTNNTTTPWYIQTSNIDTEGASTLDITVRIMTSGTGFSNYINVEIYNGTTLIETETATKVNYEDEYTYSFDISSYSTISIKLVTPTISSGANTWIGFGIVNAVLK